MKRSKDQEKMVPPDGGWGWMIILGACLINFSTRSIEPSFGLLFGGLLKELGVQTTGASLVMSTLSVIINFSGLMIGPLLKRYTIRKVAIVAGILSTSAILLTVSANSMIHLLITFGILGGIGFGLGTACTLVGINEYFTKKKGQAVGLSMTGTALGFIFMPQIIRFLLDEYGFRSALLIFGAISLHAIVGACLFQPVSWHMTALIVEVEKEEVHTLLPCDKIEKKDSSASIESINEVKQNASSPNLQRRKNLLNIPHSRKKSLISIVSDLDGTGNTFKKERITDQESQKRAVDSFEEGINMKTILNNQEKKTIANSISKYLFRFSKFMDLGLLRDWVYLNILYGLSMSVLVEMNFKLIMPFFLSNLGFTNSEIAFALSSMAVTDLCTRVIVPPILDRISITRRATFIFGCTFVALGRSCLTLQKSVGSIITTLVIIGFFRGINITSAPLVLSEYSSVDNFPSVLGLSMACRGIFAVVLGPLSGYLRDVTNSYVVFIHTQNALIFSVFVGWIIEMIILKTKQNKQKIVEASHKGLEISLQ